MYGLEDLKYAIKHPNLAARELNRFWHTRLFTRDWNTSGDDFMTEDWDNMIILDACRYDMFEEHNTIEGELESRISRGSATIGFLKGNFDGRKFHDTVYVTANPQLEWNTDKVETEFYKIINLWEDEDSWNEELHTVLPEKVTERALEAAEEHPDKRILVHYMQPHTPFLPEEGEEAMSEYIYWHRIMEGVLNPTKEEAWELYNNNLKRAMPHVKELVEKLGGKTVVTADHGNMVGERSFPIPSREWGHPNRTYTEQLIKVPWLVIDGDRREIVEEEPEKSASDSEEEQIKEKLKHLGYE